MKIGDLVKLSTTDEDYDTKYATVLSIRYIHDHPKGGSYEKYDVFVDGETISAPEWEVKKAGDCS